MVQLYIYINCQRFTSIANYSVYMNSQICSKVFITQSDLAFNRISELSDAMGADVSEMSRSIGRESCIGPKSLKASVDFGGSCFQKDLVSQC